MQEQQLLQQQMMISVMMPARSLSGGGVLNATGIPQMLHFHQLINQKLPRLLMDCSHQCPAAAVVCNQQSAAAST